MYNEEQMKLLMQELKDFNYFFGYADKPDEDDTMTTFFRYSVEDDGGVMHDKELLESRFNGYLEKNEESMARIIERAVNPTLERKSLLMNEDGITVTFPPGISHLLKIKQQ